MSANFYDLSGVMAGVDLHTWISMPVPPAPVPIPFVPHIVAGMFLSVTAKLWRIVPSVTTFHFPVLQSQWGLLIVKHAPPPPPPPPLPHPTEALNLVGIIAASGSGPFMSVHSVTGKGEALATCIYSAYGWNNNCGTVPMPSGSVLNLNSVKTTPSAGDWVNAAIAAAVAAAFGALCSFAGGAFGGASKKVGDAIGAAAKGVAEKVGAKAAEKVADVVTNIAIPVAIAAIQAAADAAKKAGIPYAPWADPATRGGEKAGEAAQKKVDGE